MVHWIYILKCEEDVFYVGETTRLFRRFWEHENGCGGVNTELYPPETIVAIYPVHRVYRFLCHNENVSTNNYNTGYNLFFNRGGSFEDFNVYDDENDSSDHLLTENFITEKLMIDNPIQWNHIRGGKYTRFEIEYCFPINPVVHDLPNCYCGFPCDVKKNEEGNYLYFRCAKKNMWEDLIEVFEVEEEPCNFFIKYTKDHQYRIDCENRKKQIKQLIGQSDWLKQIKGGQFEYCLGGCGKVYDGDYCIRYARKAINLCFDCFLNPIIYNRLKENHSNLSNLCEIDLTY